MRTGLWGVIALSAVLTQVSAVKQEDFRLCSQSSFCRRLRAIGEKQVNSAASFVSPYTVGPASTTASTIDHASWSFPISSSLYPEITFELRVDILEKGDGIARIRMDEVGSKTPFKRYNETAKWALVNIDPPLASLANAKLSSKSGKSIITYGKGLTIEITHSPLKITQLRDGQPEIILNERSLFHMEHFRTKQEKVEDANSESEQMVLNAEQDRSWFEEADGDAFTERWRTWTDSKPKGPEGLSVDLTFPGVEHIYGLPEHASPLSLPDTIGPNAHYTDPYRLFNVDIFEYLADSPMSLYGAIPLVHAHSAKSSVGVLNLIASDTYVDVLHDKQGTHTHWMSESGILDLLLLPGPRPEQLFEQFAILTGPTALPPQWSTAYHQCRWNYINEEDVLEVDRRFDESDIPLDVTWLDVEYTVDRRYFDWNAGHFPDVKRMLQKVADKGRKMVAIIDPHVKRTESYRIYNDAKDLDILIKKADGTNFEGWCWPGHSVWVDFFNPKSWTWWTKMFDFSVWKDSAPNLFIWNDMNEPSVFDGPEISVPRDTIHDGGWENRDVHNINGMLFHNATAQALIARENPAKRPFVLSRAFYTGSQRFGAIWTGDNMGDWAHFAGETAMLLSNNIAGMSFCGADVGGFFGDPSHEILVRWYQAGAFMPFFRAHAHIDTKRREPFLYDEPIRGYLRDAVRLRYQLLPVWYNAFHDASVTGAPIIKPQYAVFPTDEAGFAIDDQYYVGDSGILVKPVTTEGATHTDIYISDNQPYYDYFTHYLHPAQSKGHKLTLATPLSTFPVLIRGGHVFPIRQRVRRSSPLMWQDPFTLIVALSKEGSASGQLYLDDGETFGHEQGEFIWRSFDFTSKGKGGVLRSSNKATGQSDSSTAVTPYDENNVWAKAIAHVKVERIVVLGLKAKPSGVTVAGQNVEFTWEDGVASNGKKEGGSSKLVIKSPGLGVVEAWEVDIA